MQEERGEWKIVIFWSLTMEAGHEGQRMLNPLGEKSVGDLIIAKNSWTHCPILSSIQTGTLDILWLLKNLKECTQHHLLFSPSNQTWIWLSL